MRKSALIAVVLIFLFSVPAFGSSFSSGTMAVHTYESSIAPPDDTTSYSFFGVHHGPIRPVFHVPYDNQLVRVNGDTIIPDGSGGAGFLGDNYFAEVFSVNESFGGLSIFYQSENLLANIATDCCPRPDLPKEDHRPLDMLAQTEKILTASYHATENTAGIYLPVSFRYELSTEYLNDYASFFGEVEVSMYTEGDNPRSTSTSFDYFDWVSNGDDLSGDFIIPLSLTLDNLYFGDPEEVMDGELVNFRVRLLTESVAKSAVPEPSTMILFGTGLIGLVGWGRKKFQKR